LCILCRPSRVHGCGACRSSGSTGCFAAGAELIL
jgi:hypothetical protein